MSLNTINILCRLMCYEYKSSNNLFNGIYERVSRSRKFYSKTAALYVINFYILLFVYLIPCLQSSALVLLVLSTHRPRHTVHCQTELRHSDHNRYCLNRWGMLVQATFFSNLGSFSAFLMQLETNYLVC